LKSFFIVIKITIFYSKWNSEILPQGQDLLKRLLFLYP